MSIQLGQWSVDSAALRKILDFLPFPFLISQPRNNIRHNTFVNRKFIEEIGYTSDEIPTITEWFTLAYPDPEYRRHIHDCWEILINKAIHTNEESVFMKALIRTKFSGKQWYEVKSSLSGEVQLVAFVNIHEEVVREQELMRLNENQNRTLAILSHDLRGPLANLHALAQLALNRHLTQKEFVDTVKNVQEKTFQALEFLDTTLHWTRTNFDKIHLKLEHVNLDAIVKNILRIYESSYSVKHLNIAFNYQDYGLLESDSEIITIVFRNLISNAIKFTPDYGTITINVHHDGMNPFLSVGDSGIGMNDLQIRKIFSDQYHSEEGTRQEKGLGIGLRLCNELLKKINASMSIESIQGTTVKITFS